MINKKPIIPNNYKIDNDTIINFCIYADSNIEIYELKNKSFLNLISKVEKIPNSNYKKYNIQKLKFTQKEYLYFISIQNYEQTVSELYNELTTLRGFAAVAGMQELKQQLTQDIILPIQNKDKYEKFKIKIPNGILLYGPPGCGKTFIVRKLAEELNFSYFEIKHSDVMTPYIHGGVEKIAAIFEKAKLKVPAIIFIDEFDGLVPDRASLNGSQSYKLEEINEFLTHLNDAGKNGILVIGATNQPDLIDKAVLRSGRFDKKIYVMPPDFDARKHLFKMYLFDRPTKDIDYDILSGQTINYSCSDIEYICNESARVAVANNLDYINENILLEIILNTKSSIKNYLI